MPEEILFEIRNHIGHVTLNRPAVLNALSHRMILALDDQLNRWAEDSDVNAIIVRGAGNKAFCAGGDIREVYDSIKSGQADPSLFFVQEYRLDYYIHHYPKPYIALMDGIVMGGGMGIAQGAWLRIVTDRTRLAMPEVGIGFFPDVGGSYFLSRCPGSVGLFLGLTGLQIRAADTLYASLANKYLAHEKIHDLDRLLDALTWTSDHRSDLGQAIIAAGVSELPDAPLAELRPAIDEHFSKDSVTGILNSLKAENRSRYVSWARDTCATLAKRSPTMMCVTHEQIRRGKTMALAQCFQMEVGMVHECFLQGDFAEGVRALIVDKDMQPKWNPPTLEEVNPASVARFFTERWPKDQHPLANLSLF
jgi:enoyl-CoA hydratase/carnithine racemase